MSRPGGAGQAGPAALVRDPRTGAVWGQAAAVAAQLGLDPATGPELVRSWGRRGRIAVRRVPGAGRGTTLYPLAEAEAEEQRTRRAGTGRPRGA